jgi:hypothetical protein
MTAAPSHLGPGVLLMRPPGEGSSSAGRPARLAPPRFSGVTT